jgi:flagellar biosynthesis/type III secretory pathway protein FliH
MADPIKAPDAKYAKFAFETEFFDVADMTGLDSGGGEAPRLPRNLQEAREEGLREGLARGRAEGEAILAEELAGLKQQVATLTQRLAAEHAQWEADLTRQALSLIRLTLHHLLGHAAAHYSDQVLEHHLRDLLQRLQHGEGLTLRVNPQAKVYHEKLALPQASIGHIPFKIVTDPALGPTDVVMEWPGGGLESKLSDHVAAMDALIAAAGATPLPATPLPAESELKGPPEDSPLADVTQKTKSRAAELLGDDEFVDALK